MKKGTNKIINNIYNESCTLLMNLCYYACKEDYISVLVENGEDIHITNKNGETCLYMYD